MPRTRLGSVSSSDRAIITQDLTGTITTWNRAAEQIFGYIAAEAIGHSIRLIVPSELCEEEEEEEQELLRRIRAGESLDNCGTVRVRK